MKEKQISTKSSKTKDLVYVALFTALIAGCAQITIPLTVPFTLQTLGVCLAAGLLGLKRGTLSVVIYILLGAVGAPVFSGFKGGFGVIFGSTGGYIIGFVFTALIVGFCVDKFGKKIWVLLLSMILGILICYIFGTTWFSVVYNKNGDSASLITILTWCVFPFIPFDLIKIVVATILTNRLQRFITIK